MAIKYLTTTDNPYDPFIQPDEWRNFDEGKNYFTNNYVARVANISPDMNETQEQNAWNRAVEECAMINALGIYKIVETDTEATTN